MNADIIAASWQDFYKAKQTKKFINHGINYKSCFECRNTTLLYNQTHDETVCNSCGMIQHFNNHSKRNMIEYFPDTSNKIKRSIYKNRDYLNRKLDELSCARICIDPELFDNVTHELQSREPTVKILKTILRRLGHKQKFLQIPTFLNMLRPDIYPPIILNYQKRHKVEIRFLKYISTFNALQRNGRVKRKNLLNYNYVLLQIFQHLKLNIKSHYFDLPKGKKTLDNHKEIWDIICHYNKW